MPGAPYTGAAVLPVLLPSRAARWAPRLAAWLALLATLALALAPTLARAFGPPAPAMLTAVCSAGGWRWVVAPADALAGTDRPARHAAEGCPWCPPGVTSLGASPPSIDAVPVSVAWRPQWVQAIHATPRTARFVAASARGPPA